MNAQHRALAALAVTLLAASCGQPPQSKTPADAQYQPITAQDLATATEAPAAVMATGQHQPITADELANPIQPASNPIYQPMTAEELANANANGGH